MRRTETLGWHCGILGALGALSLVFAACSDSIHLDPMPAPSGTGAGAGGPGGSGPGGGGSGGGFGLECASNTDCPAPAAICDTARNACVECLQFADCAFRPGTVCSLGHCVCPNAPADSFCGAPARCVNLMTAREDCGQCGHACFGTCNAGTCGEPWEPTSLAGAPAPRSHHVAVWTGARMVVWGGTVQGGGATNTGGIYDPVGRAWAATSVANAPSPRWNAKAVWTGTKMIVWGGRDGAGWVNTGGIFDPMTNTWQAMTTSGAPSPRHWHSAVWAAGMQPPSMLVWGGFDGTANLGDGAAYNPESNTWASLPGAGAVPTQRREHVAVWTGTNMIVWGGYGYDPVLLGDANLGDGGIYDPSSSTWTAISMSAAPTPRNQHKAVWTGTGTEMIVWGGWDGTAVNTGAIYNATGAAWTPMNPPAPSGRQFHTAIWLGSRMIVWGGEDSAVRLDTGGIYDPVTNTWNFSAIPAAPGGRSHHTAVETGSHMIVWGGLLASGVTNEGGIFDPAFMP